MTYATPEEVALAESLSFEWTVDRQRGHQFTRGSRRVWAASYYRDGERVHGWQSADIISDDKGEKFCGHLIFDRLESALRRW